VSRKARSCNQSGLVDDRSSHLALHASTHPTPWRLELAPLSMSNSRWLAYSATNPLCIVFTSYDSVKFTRQTIFKDISHDFSLDYGITRR
jgi:hypothetical protein